MYLKSTCSVSEPDGEPIVARTTEQQQHPHTLTTTLGSSFN